MHYMEWMWKTLFLGFAAVRGNDFVVGAVLVSDAVTDKVTGG